MEQISWTTITVTLGELIPQPDNPRQIRERGAELLVESQEEFGQTELFLVGPSLEVYNGHQRREVWLAEYGENMVVEARQSNRALTRAEWQKLTILMHKGAAGGWNMDALANWGIEEDLLQWGFEKWELGGLTVQGSDDTLDYEKYGDEEQNEQVAPEDFAEYGEDLPTDYLCPKCGYEWAGTPK